MQPEACPQPNVPGEAVQFGPGDREEPGVQHSAMRTVCDLNHNFAVWQGYGLFCCWNFRCLAAMAQWISGKLPYVIARVVQSRACTSRSEGGGFSVNTASNCRPSSFLDRSAKS